MDAIPGPPWIVTIVLTLATGIFINLLSDSVRNRIAAVNKRLAQRRIDALLGRVGLLCDNARHPWRLHVRLLQATLQALIFFVVALVNMLIAARWPNDGSRSDWIGLLIAIIGYGMFYLAWYIAYDAIRAGGDALYAQIHMAEIVASIETLRRRYPGSAVNYPAYSEVQEAVAKLRAERPVEVAARGEEQEGEGRE